MKCTINIMKSPDGLYAFAVDNFQSMRHYFLVPGIKPLYGYAWQAYRDAVHIANKKSYHVVTSSEEQNELTYEDISAETRIIDHYRDILDFLNDRADGFEDEGSKGRGENERKIVYEEIKSVVSELLNLKDGIDSDDDKIEIDDILDDFRAIVHDHFSDLLAEDAKAQEDEDLEPGDDTMVNMGDMGMPPEGGFPAPQGELGALEAPLIGTRLDVMLRAAAKGEETLDPALLEDILEHYAYRIGSLIGKIDPDCICKINKNDRSINVAKGSENQLRILVGEDLFVHDIMPVGTLSDIYPYDSTEFYTKYWKPVVEAVGHVKFEDFGCLLIPASNELPDVPIDIPEAFAFGAVDPENGTTTMQISFSGSPPSWLIEKCDRPIKKEHVKQAYTELDFVDNGKGAMVVCTDPTLAITEIGNVEQIIPTEQGNQIDVNFGNHVIRLHERKLEIISQLP